MLARAETMPSQPAAAEALYLEALALIDADRVRDELVEFEVLNHWASFLERRERFDEAADCLGRVAERARLLYGEARGTQVLRRWANHHWRRGDYSASEALSRRAMAHELERWADRKPDAARELRRLASRIETGEDAWLEAFEFVREYEGVGSWEVAQWERGIGTLCEATDRPELAEVLYIDSLNSHCRIWGEDCPIRVDAHEKLARLYERLDREQEALEHAERAIAIRARVGSLDREDGPQTLALGERLRRALGTSGGRE
jgi:tetratricopeptide (TPR) repeat protein